MIPVKIREKNEMHEGVDNLHQVFWNAKLIYFVCRTAQKNGLR